MTVQNFKKYMNLARVVNTTWGTGSQVKTSPSQSIKFTLRDDNLLKVSSIMIVIIPNDIRLAHEMKDRFKEESLRHIKSALKKLQTDYKELNSKESPSIKLNLIDRSVTEGLEFLTNSQYRPTKHAYFRLDVLVDIQDA